MKNFKISGIGLLLVWLSFFSLSSCNDDDNAADPFAPPMITSVSASADEDGNPLPLEPTELGFANNVYIIHGSGFTSVQKIYFNETDTFFNPTMVTDTDIVVTIDIDTPYNNSTDELKVVTKNGTAVFHFQIAPPAPLLGSFNPINANAGETITIYGDFFLNPTVTIGGVEANIISSSINEIQVEVPADSQFEYVTVSTVSGSNTAPQAIGTALYDDATTSLVGWAGAWSGTPDFASGDAIQGLFCVKHVFPGFSGLQFDVNSVASAPYKGVRVSLKATQAGQVQIILNGNFNPAGMPNLLNVTTEWQTYYVEFAKFGLTPTPSTINQITFQEWGAAGGNTIQIDDLGLVLQ